MSIYTIFFWNKYFNNLHFYSSYMIPERKFRPERHVCLEKKFSSEKILFKLIVGNFLRNSENRSIVSRIILQTPKLLLRNPVSKFLAWPCLNMENCLSHSKKKTKNNKPAAGEIKNCASETAVDRLRGPTPALFTSETREIPADFHAVIYWGLPT